MIVTVGNQPSNENGASICSLTADGVLVEIFVMSEQGNGNLPLHMSTGEIVIGGADPTDDWTAGNIYVKQGETWAKKRTLPNVLHTFGHCEHNGKLYAATGAHTGDNATWQGRVYWSEDVGDTWQGSANVAYYRVVDIISFSGKLYVITDEFYSKGVYSSTDGTTWVPVLIATPHWRQRLFVWNSKLCLINSARMGIVTIDSGGVVATIALPHIFGPTVFNGAAVVGSDLYVLCGADQSKVYKYSGGEWSYHCNLGEPCCSLLNFEDQFLIASTMGVDAKILRIPL